MKSTKLVYLPVAATYAFEPIQKEYVFIVLGLDCYEHLK